MCEGLDQFDLTRQMIRIIGSDSIQLIHQLRGNAHRIGMRHSLHHTMPYGCDRLELGALIEPRSEESGGRMILGNRQGNRCAANGAGFRVGKRRSRQADAIELAMQNGLEPRGRFEQSEADARRAAVDGQNF